MAKKRRKTTRRTTRRRAPARRKTTRRRRRTSHGGGGGRGFALVKHDAPNLFLSATYGYLEKKAAADANFALNKVPRPIDALGYTGNIAAMAYLATYLTPNIWVKRSATVIATIAAYKLGKQGEMYKSSDTTTIGDAGYEHHGDETIIDDHIMGALEEEGGMGAVSYDHAVEAAGEYV